MEINGCFPVVYPNLSWLLEKVGSERLMTSVSFLNRNEKKEQIHDTFDFKGTIFVDCGIFQEYKNDLSWKKVVSYRSKLVQWYLNLQPSIASSLDVPSLLWHKISIKKRRLLWSLRNHKYMKEKFDDNFPLFLGVSAFSEKSVKIVAKKVKETIGAVKNIALGGQVPLFKLSIRKPQLGKIVLRTVYHLRQAFPRANIHIYGAGNPRWYLMVKILGANSADYAGYIKLAGMGRIMVSGAGSRYVQKEIRVEKNGHLQTYKRPNDLVVNQKEYHRLLDCNCPVCKDSPPEALDFDREFRLVHNFYTVNKDTRLVDELHKNDPDKLTTMLSEYFTNSKLKPIADYVTRLSRR